MAGEMTAGAGFADAVRVGVTGDDAAATAWLAEFVRPWFAAVPDAPEWRLHLASRAADDAALRATAIDAAERHACFALDTDVLSLPVARDGDRLRIVDGERSCIVRLAPGAAEVIGDRATRRWRFTALLVLLEIAATRMRHDALDLHAAAVAVDGRAVALLGPKGAGKTTLWLYLLRGLAAAAIANDRAFVRADARGAVALYGVPTAVKIRAATVAGCPQLTAGLPDVERPYLYSLDELRHLGPAREDTGHTGDLALSPAQLLHQMRVAPCAAAPLGVLLVPRVRADLDGWRIAPIAASELPALVRANGYGSTVAERPPTLFEELTGGRRSPPAAQIAHLARHIPAYRVDLGRGAYADATLAARIAALARPSAEGR